MRVLFALLLAATVACATGAPLQGVPAAAPPAAPDTSSAGDRERSGAYYQFLLGMLAERQGDYDEAIRRFSSAAEQDEFQAPAYKRTATLLMRIGDVDQAEKTAKKGLAIDPGHVGFLQILGDVNLSRRQYGEASAYFRRVVELQPAARAPRLFLIDALKKGRQYQDALDELKKFDKIFPNDLDGMYYTGRTHLLKHDWAKAEKIFKRLIEKRPDFTRAYDNLAWIYRVQGKKDQAVETYKKYLAVNPGNGLIKRKLELVLGSDPAITGAEALKESMPGESDINMKFGLTYWRQAEISGDIAMFDKALDQFQLVRVADPDNRQVEFYIASLFERIGLLNEAIEMWNRILNHDGSNARDIHLKIAEIYERIGKPERSLDHAMIVAEKNPSEPELRYFVGLLYNKLGDEKNAEKAFSEAVNLKTDEEKYYFYLGVVYEKMRMFDKSILSMKKAIALKPNHSNALNYLGYLYAEQNKNLDEAEQHLVKALAIEPDNGYFIDSLGWIYFKQRRFEQALKLMLVAVRNIPPDPTVLEHLGDIYAAMGEPNQAASAYERSLNAKTDDDRTLDREATRKKLEESKRMAEEKKSR